MTVIFVALALALGALIGWLAARPAQARLQATLEQERAAQAERSAAHVRIAQRAGAQSK
jgi:hypothetical protein